TARIGYIQARLAITPAWGGGVALCNVVGASRALRMMARSEMVAADLALQLALADAVLHDGLQGTDMHKFLQPLLERSGLVMRSLKRQTRLARLHDGYAERRAAEQQDLIATWTHDGHWQAADHILS